MAETLSEAIRKALEIEGVDAKAKEIRDYIKRDYPALADKTETTTFSSTLSVQRKKVKEGTGDTRRKARRTPTSPVEASAAPQAANGAAGVDAVLAALVDVKRAVGKIGKDGVKRLLDEAL